MQRCPVPPIRSTATAVLQPTIRRFPMNVPILRSSLLLHSVMFCIALSACADSPTAPAPLDITPLANRVSSRVQCDPGNGGITLPAGFCAVVVADLVIDGKPAAARHIAVTPTGDLFVE